MPDLEAYDKPDVIEVGDAKWVVVGVRNISTKRLRLIDVRRLPQRSGLGDLSSRFGVVYLTCCTANFSASCLKSCVSCINTAKRCETRRYLPSCFKQAITPTVRVN